MSNIIISHKTALWVYRQIRFYKIPLPNNTNTKISNNSKKPSCIDYTDLKLLKSDLEYIGKLDTLICNNINRSFNKFMNSHIYSKNLPTNSLLKTQTRNVEYYISTPEFLFCQVAHELSIAKLFLLGLELCGTYCFNAKTKDVMYDVIPLTNPRRLLAFIKKLKIKHQSYPSINKAQQVAKYLEGNSASPQESKLFVRLAAPRKFGGYAIKNLKLNAKINLSRNALSILDSGFLRADISNSKTKIAIEYDSEKFHDNAKQNIRDKSRLDALHYDGWKTFSIVAPQMKDIYTFDTIARKILSSNNQDARIRKKDFEQLAYNLYKELNDDVVF